MSEQVVWGRWLARGSLFALVLIHFVLPFTPLNPYDESRIVAASLILGATFLYLALLSRKSPSQAFWGGFGLLAVVIIAAAWTGASPVAEGLWIKLAFLAVLSFAAMSGYEAEGQSQDAVE